VLYTEIKIKEPIENGHFGQIGGHFGQSNGRHGYSLVLDTTVGMGMRDPIWYNVLLIIVDGHIENRQSIHFSCTYQ
jgi:hypothetical protein